MSDLTPQQKLKLAILNRAKLFDDKLDIGDEAALQASGEMIDQTYERLDDADNGNIQDARAEVREGEVETKLPSQYSRNFEAKEVAAKMHDGSWVGWTFWYGGGKHSEPEAIDWMEEAYDLDCKEEEKTVTIQTFTKREAK